MTLQEQLREDLKAAMRAGEAQKRDVIRFLESAVKNVAIEKRKPVTELSDEEVLEVVRRSVKQRKDSIAQYTAGGREDLASTEQEEVVILQAYLPQGLDESVIRELVAQSLAESGVTEMKDFGRAMGAAMKLVAGRAEGRIFAKSALDSSLFPPQWDELRYLSQNPDVAGAVRAGRGRRRRSGQARAGVAYPRHASAGVRASHDRSGNTRRATHVARPWWNSGVQQPT